jgi:hypothetical protein
MSADSRAQVDLIPAAMPGGVRPRPAPLGGAGPGEAGSPSVLGVLALAVIVAVVGLLAVLDAGGGR